MSHSSALLAIVLSAILLPLILGAQPVDAAANADDPVAPPPPAGVTVQRDVEYARAGNTSLLMDIYTPKNADPKSPLPCILYIHGGAWRSGDKTRQMAVPLSTHGFIVASINHRPSTEAVFPAQIQDCKAAVRYLRGNAAKLGLDPDRIGAWGDSSGGHLASLLGTSSGDKDLEGTLGDFPKESSRVQAVADYYGPIDFLAILNQKSNIQRGVYPTAPEAQLLGGNTLDKKELAAQACPLTYLSKNTPPFIIIHGGADAQVPIAQSEGFKDALEKNGTPVSLHVIDGAPHGFNDKQQAAALPFTLEFFNRTLKPSK